MPRRLRLLQDVLALCRVERASASCKRAHAGHRCFWPAAPRGARARACPCHAHPTLPFRRCCLSLSLLGCGANRCFIPLYIAVCREAGLFDATRETGCKRRLDVPINGGGVTAFRGQREWPAVCTPAVWSARGAAPLVTNKRNCVTSREGFGGVTFQHAPNAGGRRRLSRGMLCRMLCRQKHHGSEAHECRAHAQNAGDARRAWRKRHQQRRLRGGGRDFSARS